MGMEPLMVIPMARLSHLYNVQKVVIENMKTNMYGA